MPKKEKNQLSPTSTIKDSDKTRKAKNARLAAYIFLAIDQGVISKKVDLNQFYKNEYLPKTNFSKPGK